jgi:hypothetical protein
MWRVLLFLAIYLFCISTVAGDYITERKQRVVEFLKKDYLLRSRPEIFTISRALGRKSNKSCPISELEPSPNRSRPTKPLPRRFDIK